MNLHKSFKTWWFALLILSLSIIGIAKWVQPVYTSLVFNSTNGSSSNGKNSIDNSEVLQKLIEGNQRFVKNIPSKKNHNEQIRKSLVANGQKPYAVIVSCSDSRVSPELIFDSALGELFVIRNAGNVINPETLGSIEYGVVHGKASTIIVLGHQHCGAIKTTVDEEITSPNIETIVSLIKPSLHKAKATPQNKASLYDLTTLHNIENSMAEIQKSTIITKLQNENKVKIFGAHYNLETGEVEILN